MKFYHFALKLATILFYFFNGKPHIEGLEHLPQDEPVIIAGTHRSYLDPFFVAMATTPREISYMAKHSLFKFKFIAFLLKKANVFPVNRDKPSASTIKFAVKQMNEHGLNLGIFPSGTRHSTEIKSGTAFIQKLSKRTIVPVAIQPPIGMWQFFSRKRAKLAFGQPIFFDESVTYDKEKLAEIDALLAQRFDELDKQLDPNYVYIPKNPQ